MKETIREIEDEFKNIIRNSIIWEEIEYHYLDMTEAVPNEFFNFQEREILDAFNVYCAWLEVDYYSVELNITWADDMPPTVIRIDKKENSTDEVKEKIIEIIEKMNFEKHLK